MATKHATSNVSFGLIAGLIFLAAANSLGQALKSLDPPVLLPDGTEFKTWEAPIKSTRTYYVDGSNPKASDANPGTKNSLFAPSTRRPEFLVLGNASSSQQVFIENGSARFEMERVVTK